MTRHKLGIGTFTFQMGNITHKLVALCVLTVSFASFGSEAKTVLDELMPRPAIVEAASSETVPAEKLRDAVVVHGAVPGAPTATADEAYILEVGTDGAKITAQTAFGERWARVTLDQLVRLTAGLKIDAYEICLMKVDGSCKKIVPIE